MQVRFHGRFRRAHSAEVERDPSSLADGLPIARELCKSSSQAEASWVNWMCTRKVSVGLSSRTGCTKRQLSFPGSTRGDVKSCCMRKPPASGIDSGIPVTVLSVSPIAEDHILLAAMFDRSEHLLSVASGCILRPCATLKSAMYALSQAQYPLVISERDLGTDSWRDVLDNLLLLPDPPVLIVTSRLADEYLWAEALNLGAYDVLAKPFEASEVRRVISSAWRHWTDLRSRIQVRNPQPMVAGTAA